MAESLITTVIKALHELEEDAKRLSTPSQEEVSGIMNLAEQLAEELRGSVESIVSDAEKKINESLGRAIEELRKRMKREKEERIRETEEAAKHNFDKAVDMVFQLLKGALA